MKHLKSILCLLVVFVMLLTGCGGKGTGKTMLYNYADLDKYVTLGKYKGITVDTASDDFKLYIDSVTENDLSSAELYETYELTSKDTVQNNDTVVIDFAGKMNGVAFEGGTSTDYQLTIGSGSMIDGFESGIIGAKLNQKFTIDLSFPDPYPNNEELSGKPVSFDITVKSGTRITFPEITEDVAKSLGFTSKSAYDKDVNQRAKELYFCDLIVDASTIISYPEKELEYYLEETTLYYEQLCESYGMTFDEFLTNQNMTLEQYEESVKEELKANVATQLVFYSIAQKENIEITDKATDDFIKEAAEQNGVTIEEVKEQISEGDLEFYTLVELVTEFLMEENSLI